MRTADGLDFLHPFFNRGLREIRAFFEFLQNAGSLVFLLETLQCAVNGFVVVNIDSDQKYSPPHTLPVGQGVNLLVNFQLIVWSRSFRTIPRSHCRRSMCVPSRSPCPCHPNRYGRSRLRLRICSRGCRQCRNLSSAWQPVRPSAVSGRSSCCDGIVCSGTKSGNPHLPSCESPSLRHDCTICSVVSHISFYSYKTPS